MKTKWAARIPFRASKNYRCANLRKHANVRCSAKIGKTVIILLLGELGYFHPGSRQAGSKIIIIIIYLF